ncbi:hypothetical protein SAMN05421837_108364 [Amycolatopsis pretoriensis]|uniref:DUF6801 domain-containing protein n=1 Tax=Amycolatopsis pretoriensis TaxID=218821 RepID=A0A1H5RBQ6_9PSEU|nr:DUF6801 domain-containing protein [Amycolatopsis pretoriensis]SEF35769.1 hypothetical protein SAMN05421837_108364 [Amycolatopsis pretoriensis]
MAARPTRRTAARGAIALVCAVTAATGALTGTGSAAPGATAPDPGARYAAHRAFTATCPFADPVGAVTIAMNAEARLPASVRSGDRATIDGFTVRLGVPRTAALQLLGPDGTELEGGLTVDLVLEQGKVRDTLAVPLTIAATALPADGDLSLVATGKVPGFSVTSSGATKIRLAAPRIALGPAAPAASGTAPAPAPQATCTAAAGQDLSFGYLVVGSAAVPAKPVAPAPGKPAPKVRGGGKQHNLIDDDPPPDDTVTLRLPLLPNQVDNTTDIVKTGAKIHSNAAALVNGMWVQVTDQDGNQISGTITGELSFTPVTVTYLGYGFLPISATVEFLPDDYRRGKEISSKGSLVDGILYNHLDVRSRLSDVKVNGVPLDAGPDCVSESTISIDMLGEYGPFEGGTIKTDPDNPDPKYRGFTLPPFRNCGAAEKLSSLFTGQNSGPGNQATANLAIIQPCFEADHTLCPPTIPIPAEVFRNSR